MARKTSFTPPDDDTEDVLSVLAAPASRAVHAEPTQPVAAPFALPSNAQAESGDPVGHRAVVPPTDEFATAVASGQLPSGTPPRTSGSGVAPKSTTRTRARRTAAETEKTGVKRIGLYVNEQLWLRLKRISLERAEQGLPSDLTSIFVEALNEKYRR